MQTPIIHTISNAQAQNIGARGVGFRLEPLTNAATGNPVAMAALVRLNRNDSMLFPLRDDGPRWVAEGFDCLELVGGALGDRWIVTVFETSLDGVGAPGRLYKPPSLLVDKTDFGDLLAGDVYNLPNANGLAVAASLQDSVPIDCTRFSGVHVFAGVAEASEFSLTVQLWFLGGPKAGAPVMGSASTLVRPGGRAQFVVSEGAAGELAGAEGIYVGVPLRPTWLVVRAGKVFGPPPVSPPSGLPVSTFIRAVGLE